MCWTADCVNSCGSRRFWWQWKESVAWWCVEAWGCSSIYSSRQQYSRVWFATAADAKNCSAVGCRILVSREFLCCFWICLANVAALCVLLKRPFLQFQWNYSHVYQLPQMNLCNALHLTHHIADAHCDKLVMVVCRTKQINSWSAVVEFF